LCEQKDNMPETPKIGSYTRSLTPLVLLFSLILLLSVTVPVQARPWPFFDRYARTFLQDDGRVIDRDAGGRTTSEGEAYALFFSLVEENSARFGTILKWTEENLAKGDLFHHLPAWLWGRRPDGTWGVLDAHSASDADCWLAYDLLEAGRLWHRPDLRLKGMVLLKRIAPEETASFSGNRSVLLPGPSGFIMPDGSFRLNPSYTPSPLLRRFSSVDPDGPWRRIRETGDRLFPLIAPRGFVPDWFLLRPDGSVSWDPVKGPVGSFDAIRVYLWEGLQSSAGMCRKHGTGFRGTGGIVRYLETHRVPPAIVNTFLGTGAGEGSPGFSAALLPYLQARGERRAYRIQQSRVEAAFRNGLLGSAHRYYDQNLALFGLGFMEGRFSFSRSGKLVGGKGVLNTCGARISRSVGSGGSALPGLLGPVQGFAFFKEPSPDVLVGPENPDLRKSAREGLSPGQE
jgi:endo-1,4-beta-D-glucanase Y